jgi:beta-lactamase superfamily II metal-dependent hydrolase
MLPPTMTRAPTPSIPPRRKHSSRLRRLAAAIFAPAAMALAGEARVGQPLPAWTEGTLDIHQVNTGRGDAAFFILPDGTTLLLDAGAVAPRRDRPANYDAPTRPDDSRRAGEWVARYIQAVHPRGRAGAVDYAAITHFHADHMGEVAESAPMAASGAYRLSGITDVAEQVPVRRVLDRGWPEYDFPRPLVDRMMLNYRAFLQWQIAERKLQVERFEPGRNDQIVLRHAAARYPSFEVRNIAANGRVWTGEGTEARSRFPAFDRPGENNCSLAFRLRYGRFTYFNGGDMAGEVSAKANAWHDLESALAWVVGPVDVHALNHHGFADAMNTFFLSVLQPRVHVLAVYASSHPGPEVMRRMLSPRIYPGPRDIFMTNGLWEGRRTNMVKLFGEENTAFLEGRMAAAAATQGHIVVRVAPGGDSYGVYVLDDGDESRHVRSIHGPYQSGHDSRAAAAGAAPRNR